ncbi:hypothetical protein ACIA49_27580 [Kribbella sp. NPDC051587]|uniref:hypothetical protein n=1 Tax=Kribbella sp. NPDC051587 TaxID=3364119 RepID=UPI0037A975B9
MDEFVLAGLLAEVGLRFVGWIDPATPLIPPRLATFAGSSSSEDDAYGDAVALDDPELRAKANATWYQLASRARLFDSVDKRFLTAIKSDDEGRGLWWAVVELRDVWDIVGAGAASQLFGYRENRPAFVMISVDGNVVLRCDVGEVSIDFSVVPDARRAPTLLRRARRIVETASGDDGTRSAAERWLGVVEQEASAT